MPEMATVAKANQAARPLSLFALSDALAIDTSSVLSRSFTDANEACIFSSDDCKAFERTEEIAAVGVESFGEAANDIPR